jgi:hypothetical protein
MAVFLVLACGHPQTSGSPPDPGAAERAWQQGLRDSAQAGAVACELATTLQLLQHPCLVAAYAETSHEYVLRVTAGVPKGAGSDGAAPVVVRLSKQGDSATVERIARP